MRTLNQIDREFKLLLHAGIDTAANLLKRRTEYSYGEIFDCHISDRFGISIATICNLSAEVSMLMTKTSSSSDLPMIRATQESLESVIEWLPLCQESCHPC